MCKAIGYVKELKGIIEKIDQDYNTYYRNVKVNELTQQDILHEIENMNRMSACDGYKLAKMLQDCRRDRRGNKNELQTLIQLKEMFTDSSKNKLDETYSTILSQDQKQEYAREHKVYRPRVLKSGIETSKKKCVSSSDANKIKSGEERYGVKFIPNAKYNNPKSSLNGANVMMLSTPMGGYYECLMVNNDGGLLRSNVKKQYIALN